MIRRNPATAITRFRALPIQDVLDAVLRAHLAVEAAGLVAVDFYDGCLYDFQAGVMHLCDLDEYRPGLFAPGRRPAPGIDPVHGARAAPARRAHRLLIATETTVQLVSPAGYRQCGPTKACSAVLRL